MILPSLLYTIHVGKYIPHMDGMGGTLTWICLCYIVGEFCDGLQLPRDEHHHCLHHLFLGEYFCWVTFSFHPHRVESQVTKSWNSLKPYRSSTVAGVFFS